VEQPLVDTAAAV